VYGLSINNLFGISYNSEVTYSYCLCASKNISADRILKSLIWLDKELVFKLKH